MLPDWVISLLSFTFDDHIDQSLKETAVKYLTERPEVWKDPERLNRYLRSLFYGAKS